MQVDGLCNAFDSLDAHHASSTMPTDKFCAIFFEKKTTLSSLLSLRGGFLTLSGQVSRVQSHQEDGALRRHRIGTRRSQSLSDARSASASQTPSATIDRCVVIVNCNNNSNNNRSINIVCHCVCCCSSASCLLSGRLDGRHEAHQAPFESVALCRT
jgi:hypothetical protein